MAIETDQIEAAEPNAGSLEATMLDSEPAPAEQALGVPEVLIVDESAAARRAEPVKAEERIHAVDLLRGFALLGILAMNIVGFAWGEEPYGNPTLGGGFTGGDKAIWYFNHLFFDMKMMTLFSMLFGAGLVLMGDRAEKSGRKLTWIYYRRILWLLAIGFVHAYLIWDGDILVLYAECGLFLYLFRKWSPRELFLLSMVSMLIGLLIFGGLMLFIARLEPKAEKAREKQSQKKELSASEKRSLKLWQGIGGGESAPGKTAERVKKDINVHRGGYWGIVKDKAPDLVAEHTILFAVFGVWWIGGRMLLGMSLMKLGIFSGERSLKFYAWMATICYAIGLPIMVLDADLLISHQFSRAYLKAQGGFLLNDVFSIVVSLGHVGLLMVIYKLGAVQWLTNRLAAVGRMALSNYLTHSIVCTTIFYGYGLGRYGYLNRRQLVLIVLAIWVAQLVVSPIWLRYFRYGPAEWLWRSLTYGKRQPLRIADAAVAVPVA